MLGPKLDAVPRKRKSRIKIVVVVDDTPSFWNRFRFVSFRFWFCFDSCRLVSSRFISFCLNRSILVSVDLDSFGFDSIHFVSFSFTRSIRIRRSIRFPIVYPGKLDVVRRLLYTCCTFVSGFTLRLPHYLVLFRMLIVLTRISTRRIQHAATFREQLLRRRIHRTLFRKLTVILCCFVLLR